MPKQQRIVKKNNNSKNWCGLLTRCIQHQLKSSFQQDNINVHSFNGKTTKDREKNDNSKNWCRLITWCIQHQLKSFSKSDFDIQLIGSFLIHSWIILASMSFSSQKTKLSLVYFPWKQWNWVNNYF